MPPGLELSAGGVVSGTPTEVGGYTFTVQIADDDGPLATLDYKLDVMNVPPQVTANPTSLTVDEGSEVKFSATATGAPAPTVQWEVSTDGGTTWSQIDGATSADLAFTASFEQSGNQYRAVFTNAAASAWTDPASLTVHYAFSGFFTPVDNLPVLNVANAGRSIPVKFSLGGDQGLNIFAAGYPTVKLEACSSTTSDAIETYVQGSGLTYDPLTQQYNYVWQTRKAWAGQCGKLQIVLVDGTLHEAEFRFK